MDSLDRNLSKIFKSEITVPESFEQTIRNSLNGKQVRKSNKSIYSIMKIAATFVITGLFGIGAVFAGVSTYNYFTKASQQQVNVAPGSNPKIDEEYGIIRNEADNGIHYKKISTYEEYQKCKKIWPELYDMNESDFKDYFMVMISIGENSKLPFYVSEVKTDENNLYIKLSQSNDEIKYDHTETFFSLKIERKNDRDKIMIKREFLTPNMDLNKYTDIKEIKESTTYTKQQAIQEGCFVVENSNVISDDKLQVSNFVKNTEAGKEETIRIASYDSSGNMVIDIEYRNGKYYVSKYMDNKWTNEISLTYDTYDSLIEKYITLDGNNWYHDIIGHNNDIPGMRFLIVSYI